jgi:hypothetical protein
MALNSANNKTKGRDIKYLNKDFGQFRQNLIDYTKTYFPQTYSDFNEASPGMMFIEMASYLGDVLSYYLDDTLKESLITSAEDPANVIALANYLGYKPKVTSPSITKLSVYQLVPSKYNTNSGGTDYEPDANYYLRLKEGMIVESTNGISFRTTEQVDFNNDTDREISIYERNPDTNKPSLYLIRKFVNVISADIKSIDYDFGATPQQFSKITITDTNVIDIYDVRDSSGNKWYEVPYLAQEMVYVDYPLSEQTDKDLSQLSDQVSSVLKLVKTTRRFTKQINSDGTVSLVFGGGNSTSSDETLIPNFKNVGLGLNSSIDKLGASFDPANFLKTTSYGQAPKGSFTISYLIGGGVSANVSKNSLTRVQSISYDEDTTIFTDDELKLYNFCKSSIGVDNEEPATGGRGAETIDEIRENALANFGSQNRAVTRKDYQVRALSLPAKYGGIAKAYCAPDGELDNNSPSSILSNPNTLQQFTELVISLKEKEGITEQEIKKQVDTFLSNKQSDSKEKNNPFAINLYVLGYDSSKKLSTLNQAVKENLKTYLGEYRLLTDGVNLLNGFVINVGVDFEIRVYGGYNKREVLVKCISEIQNYFNIDNWTFNMPINISELELLIAGVEGVQSVPKCSIVNKCKGNYASTSYNIEAATRNKMVYPSLDPSVFEVKYPNKDIQGRVV